MAAQHPELDLTLANGGTIATAKSDHVAFVSRAVRSLFFYGSARGEQDETGDTPEAIDAEQAARMLRLIYCSRRDVANAEEWAPEGRGRRIMLLANNTTRIDLNDDSLSDFDAVIRSNRKGSRNVVTNPSTLHQSAPS